MHMVCAAQIRFSEPRRGRWEVQCFSVTTGRWSLLRGYSWKWLARRFARRVTRMTGAPHRVVPGRRG